MGFVLHSLQARSCCHRTVRPFTSSCTRPSAVLVVAKASSPSADEVVAVPRRDLLLLSLTAGAVQALTPQGAEAGFKKELKKKKIPLEEYSTSEVDGLRYYDLEEGRGKAIENGDTVVVHFDCLYRGIDAVSSRYARTLGGNRTIAEPYEFVAGGTVSGNQARKSDGGSAGGLFVGGSGPKPPPALATAVIGMKPGGKRTIYIDVPELGYPKGNQEIPAGEPFELKVEVLSAAAGLAASAS